MASVGPFALLGRSKKARMSLMLSFVKSRWTCSAVDLDTVGVQVGRYGRLVGFLCLLVIS